ncbi:PREDICTED: transcription factor bHLH10-like isoform X1 [Camelina sativa]|uniref:Transcription factor bHLH10-like isoform X1 n=2 Tax=Camelina sativa TaxID=90675 RepID=A0ABM0WE22_CAMSA|nr:PREDICTED: transcription factor bHLH10-like isoform X1 [Camelina sativa]
MEEEKGNLYEEMGCFDPNTPAEVTVETSFSQPEQPPPPPQQQQPPQILVAGSTSNSNCSVEVEELSEFHLSPQDCPQPASTPLQFHINPPPPPCDQFHNNMIHQMATHHQQQQSDWDQNNGYQDFVNMVPNSATTPDLLSLLHLPRCSLPPPPLHHHPSSMLPNSFSDIMSSSSAAAVMYDPLFHLNFPMQPRDQNHLRNGSSSCLLGVEDQIQMDANGGVNMMYFEGGHNNNDNNGDGFDNGVLEFNTTGVVTRKRRRSKKSNTSPTERERRVHFHDRFQDLKSLIPNPTKSDRASIVGEAIDYIKELLRTIEEFKMLVEKKRFGRFRSKKKARRGEDQHEEEEDTVNYKPQSEVDQSCFNKNNNSLRCSWLKRKSKVTEVDVRIIDDEVTIKLVQKKKINCLLFTTKVLDQLQLDLHHVAGGQIGEHYSFLFNTKICEGSCVYASGIADTVMEVVEKQYMEAVPSNGY